MTAIYDTIGQTYGSTRRADSRIVSALNQLIDLPSGATICDLGAGSGNYANALANTGYRIVAVEPSETMRAQAEPHELVTWKEGWAEDIPLATGAAHAIVCTLSVHHFSDLNTAIREMERVCPTGPLVFFTFDPHSGQEQWFADYFPEIRLAEISLFPPVEELVAFVTHATGRRADVMNFPLPPDLSDQILHAPWAEPETYLDPQFRANTSGFANADAGIVANRVEALADDLATGLWDHKFGHFRSAQLNDAGFFFVRFRR